MAAIDTDDLGIVYDILKDANKKTENINNDLSNIRDKTDSKVRLSSQKIQVDDSYGEQQDAIRIKQNMEDDARNIENMLIGFDKKNIVFSDDVLSSNDNQSQQTYAFDGNFNFRYSNTGDNTANTQTNNQLPTNESLDDIKQFCDGIDSRDDLTPEEKDYYKTQYANGNKRAVVFAEEIKDLETKINDSQQKLNELKGNVNDIREQYEIEGKNLDSLLEARDNQNNYVNDLKSQLSMLENEKNACDDAEYADAYYGGQIDNINDKIKANEEYLDELNDELKDYDNNQKEIEEEERKIRELNKQLNQFKEKQKQYEYDNLEGKRATEDYQKNADIEQAINACGIKEFGFGNFNISTLIQLESVDISPLALLIYMYTSEEYKAWFESEYPGLEFSKENIVDKFGGVLDENNEISLEIRAFLMLSDDQLKDYVYLYNKEGMESATNFLRAFESDINNKLGFEMAIDAIDKIDNFDTLLGELCATLGIGIEDGIVGCFNNIATAFNRNTTMTPAEYKALYLSQMFLMANNYLEISADTLEEMRKEGKISDETYNKALGLIALRGSITQLDLDLETGQITKEMYDEFMNLKENDPELSKFIDTLKEKGIYFNYTYQIGSNIGNMLPSQFMGIISGGAGWASSLTLFISAYGGSYKESKREGYDEIAANIYALLSGGSEVATEYFLGKIAGLSGSKELLDAGDDIAEVVSRWQIFTNMMKTTALDIFDEIKEEELQNVLDAVFKWAVYGEPIEISGQEMIDTAIITFFTTGLMNAPTNASSLVAQNINYSNLQKTVSFKLENGKVAEISTQELLNFINKDTGKVDFERLNNYLNNGDLSNSKVNISNDKQNVKLNVGTNRVIIDGQVSEVKITKNGKYYINGKEVAKSLFAVIMGANGIEVNDNSTNRQTDTQANNDTRTDVEQKTNDDVKLDTQEQENSDNIEKLDIEQQKQQIQDQIEGLDLDTPDFENKLEQMSEQVEEISNTDDNNTVNYKEKLENLMKDFYSLYTNDEKVQAWIDSGLKLEYLNDEELFSLLGRFDDRSEFTKEIFNNMSLEYQIKCLVWLEKDEQLKFFENLSSSKFKLKNMLEALKYVGENVMFDILKSKDEYFAIKTFKDRINLSADYAYLIYSMLSDEGKLSIFNENLTDKLGTNLVDAILQISDENRVNLLSKFNSENINIKILESLEGTKYLTNEIIFEYLKTYKNDKNILKAIKMLTDKQMIIDSLNYINDDGLKVYVINNIVPVESRLSEVMKQSDKIKRFSIQFFTNVEEKAAIISSIENKIELMKTLRKLSDSELIEIANIFDNKNMKINAISAITDNNLKIQQLEKYDLTLEEKIIIIASITDLNLQKEQYTKLGLDEVSYLLQLAKLIKNNLLIYQDNLLGNIKSLIFYNVSKFRSYLNTFSTKNDGYFGADQEIAKKYMYYNINKDNGNIFLDYKEDAIELLKKIYKKDNISEEEYQEYINLPALNKYFVDKITDYFLEKYQDISKVNEIMTKYFSAVKTEYYLTLVKNMMTTYNIDQRTAEIILNSINTTGVCSYAAKINLIFDIYKNKESKFFNDFGFPMYTSINGKRILNTDALLIDLYIYTNSQSKNAQLFSYENGRLIFNKNLMMYNKLDTSKQVFYGSLNDNNMIDLNNYLKSKGINLKINDSFYSFLGQYQLKQETLIGFKENMYSYLENGKKLELIITEGIKLVDVIKRSDTTVKETHAIYIDGICDEGLYVISWGKEYLIKFEDLADKNFWLYTYDVNFENENLEDEFNDLEDTLDDTLDDTLENIPNSLNANIELEREIEDFKAKLDSIFKDCKDDSEKINAWRESGVKLTDLNDDELFYFVQQLDSNMYVKQQIISKMSFEYQLKALEFLDEYNQVYIVEKMSDEMKLKSLKYLKGYSLIEILKTMSDDVILQALKERTDIQKWDELNLYKKLGVDAKLEIIFKYKNEYNYDEYIKELPVENRIKFLDDLNDSNLSSVLVSLEGSEYDNIKYQYVLKISTEWLAKKVVNTITDIEIRMQSIANLSDETKIEIIKELPEKYRLDEIMKLNNKAKCENINILSSINEKVELIQSMTNRSDQIYALENLSEMELIEFSTLISDSNLKANALALIKDEWTKQLQLDRNDLSIEDKVIIIASFNDLKKQRMEYEKLGLDYSKFNNILNQLIQANKLNYNSNLELSIKNKIYEKVSKLRNYFKQFSDGFADLFYGADQEISRKYLKYDLLTENGDFFELYRDDLIKIIKKNDSNTSLEYINDYINMIKNSGFVNLDFIIEIHEYFLEKYNGDMAKTHEIIFNYFKRNQSEHYNELINDIVGRYNIDVRTATIIIDSINSKTGVCSYAAQLNLIFDKYKNNEVEFERDFGFPMYTNIDGIKRLNSDALLIDMFIFMNDNHLESDFYNGGAEKFFKYENGRLVINSDLISNYRFKENALTYLSKGMGLNVDAINAYLQSKNSQINLTYNRYQYAESGDILGRDNLSESTLDKFKSMITRSMENGNQIELSLWKDNILTQIETGEQYVLSGGHNIYVSGISDDGLIVVSWGREYIVKFTDMYDKSFDIYECNLSVPDIISNDVVISQDLINLHRNKKLNNLVSDGPKL